MPPLIKCKLQNSKILAFIFLKKKNDFFYVLGRLKLPKNLIVPDEKKMGKKRGRIQSVNELNLLVLWNHYTRQVNMIRYV